MDDDSAIMIECGRSTDEWGRGEPFSAREAVRSTVGLTTDDDSRDGKIILSAPWGESKPLTDWFADDDYTLDNWLDERNLADGEREYWTARLSNDE